MGYAGASSRNLGPTFLTIPESAMRTWSFDFFVSLSVSSREKQGDLGVSLLCTSCHESFAEPLDLLIHVQETHSVEIFEEHKTTSGTFTA